MSLGVWWNNLIMESSTDLNVRQRRRRSDSWLTLTDCCVDHITQSGHISWLEGLHTKLIHSNTHLFTFKLLRLTDITEHLCLMKCLKFRMLQGEMRIYPRALVRNTLEGKLSLFQIRSERRHDMWLMASFSATSIQCIFHTPPEWHSLITYFGHDVEWCPPNTIFWPGFYKAQLMEIIIFKILLHWKWLTNGQLSASLNWCRASVEGRRHVWRYRPLDCKIMQHEQYTHLFPTCAVIQGVCQRLCTLVPWSNCYIFIILHGMLQYPET